MTTELQVLIVEDSEQDTALLIRKLKEYNYSIIYKRVETEDDMEKALEQKTWDIVLSDYVMPAFSGLAALSLLKRKGIDVPFIIVSGQIGEDVAVEAMRAGASDYFTKGNLRRLGAAISRELEEAENRKQRRAAERELAKSEAELRTLSHRLIKMQEDERRNLASELHDEIGHTLAYLRLLVDKASRISPEQAKESLDQAKTLLSELIEQVRTISLSLKPPMLEEDGLQQAIKYLADRYARESNIKIEYSYNGMTDNLHWDISLAAYRIVQEALTNIIKHARATRVEIKLREDKDYLNINVADNGRGFQPEKRSSGAGLRSMLERATLMGGKLHITSKPGSGTTVKASLPTGTAVSGDSDDIPAGH
jgi:signal transduction histidine kinase